MTTSLFECFDPEPGRPRPPRLSHRPIGGDGNPWPTKFTASENGNGSAASTAIPTIRAYLQPGLYETQAFAQKKAARLADHDYENGGDGAFQVVAVGESPFDERRPSLSAWWAAHPHVLDFDDCPF
jgi:hypothetical protein